VLPGLHIRTTWATSLHWHWLIAVADLFLQDAFIALKSWCLFAWRQLWVKARTACPRTIRDDTEARG